MERTAIRIVHAIPGRVRVKLGGLKANPPFARQLEERFSGVSGVELVEANPVTGSLLVFYDPQSAEWRNDLQALARGLASASPELDEQALSTYLDGSENGGTLLEARHITGLFKTLDETVAHATGGVSLKLLVPLVLVLFGVRGLLVAEAVSVPRWYDLLWFGFGTFIMLNAAGVPPVQAAEEAAEVAAAV